MRGIVVEEDIHYGVVEGKGAPPLRPKVSVEECESFLILADEALFECSGLLKEGESWRKLEVVLLTTRNFDSIPIEKITKLKIYSRPEVTGQNELKVEYEERSSIYAFSHKDAYCMFYKIYWARLCIRGVQVDPNEDFVNSCDGECLKKGEILGSWEPRYVLITLKDGLMSFRDRRDAPTLEISSTSELWTRFELVGNKRYIVFKLFYGPFKEQIAVPVERSVKWLKALHSLLKAE